MQAEGGAIGADGFLTASLHAAELGDARRTIVFLHGFGGCHGMWGAIPAAFAGGCRTLAYDLPGHGKSLGFPEAGPAKVAVRAILADLDRRGVGDFHLVGHSMGGAIAVLIALSAPDSVRSLTLLAPGGFGEEINGRLLRRYAVAKSEPEILNCLESMAGWRNPVPAKTLRALVEMRSVAGQTEKLAEIAALITRDDRQGVIPRERLETLAMPVSIVWGRLDGVLPVHQANGLPPLFGLHLVPGAGHMLAEEAPDLVAEIIRRTIR